jgi:ubiquitin carboxyl-terminal hydrolase 48
VYNLRAVLHHKGASAYSGHYVADVYSTSDNHWWHFDDDVVSCINQDNSIDGSSGTKAKDKPKNKPKDKFEEKTVHLSSLMITFMTVNMLLFAN